MLTVTTINDVVFTVAVPVGASIYDFVLAFVKGGGVWNPTSQTFYPLTQVASIVAS